MSQPPEEELQRALGGADEALFRAVFAVDLTDLGSTDAMTRDEVRELLFSASIVGQRRSAARAMANLQRQRLELARSRQADAPANRLVAELDALRRELVEARRKAAAYTVRHDELIELERQIDERREEAERIDHARELDLLARLWDVLERNAPPGVSSPPWTFRSPSPIGSSNTPRSCKRSGRPARGTCSKQSSSSNWPTSATE